MMSIHAWRAAALVSVACIAIGITACANGSSAPSASAPVATFATVVSGQPATVTVHETDGDKFAPATVSVPVGGTVEWSNTGATPHNVTFDNGGPASPTMAGGDTFELRFTQAGTYNYVCTFHQSLGMTGTVTVG